MRDAGKAVGVLNRLHDAGIKCSIDDFGTGYSSLSYIKQFAIDEIKIDRSLTCNVVSDKKDLAIVLSTIELGHNLGLEVVAEGVEDYAALDLLRQLDCDQVQGYLVTRPLAAPALVDWLNRYYAARQEVAQRA